jgi:hypothetical protein
MNTKKLASIIAAPLAIAIPMLAHAAPLIDLKAAIKAGQQKTQPAPQAGNSGTNAQQGQSIDSAAVTQVLAGIKVLDVGGVRLGMPGDEAKRVLKKLNSAFHEERLNMPGDAVRGFIMTNDEHTSKVYPTGLDRFTIYVNEAGNVFFIKRDVMELPPERHIVLSTFLNSLAEKYDAPGVDTSKRGNNQALFHWRFDMQGRQSISDGGDGRSDPCRKQGYGADMLEFQQNPLPSCAAIIHAMPYTVLRNENMVRGYLITLSAPWLWHDTGAVRASADALARQRQAEQEKLKDNKPQL